MLQRNRAFRAAVFVALLGATQAAAQPVAPQPRGLSAALSGTQWEWIRFASPAGDIRVDDPSHYTLAFDHENHAALRADCNRAAGGVGSAGPGMIRFGALAMTRAMCPPGSLSDRYVRDVGRTTRYTLGQQRTTPRTAGRSGCADLPRRSTVSQARG